MWTWSASPAPSRWAPGSRRPAESSSGRACWSWAASPRPSFWRTRRRRTSFPPHRRQRRHQLGQSCVAQTRLLVPESQYRAYAEALADGFASLKIGDPMEADTAVGPLITARQRARTEYTSTRRARRRDDRRGRPPSTDDGPRVVLRADLVTDAHNDMKVAREEIFGPVAALIPHRGEDDAIRIANDSELGLAGSVFTADTAHGFEVARRVRTGTFSVNTFAADLGSPFGGSRSRGSA
ncbi:aldehyde dehydrogenase family protein [Streptomyces sp. F001]|uniref:aldehyde dehydrogenase family protein n=1 Tax=Streptomyces sp. F001 TaxID=1510026 RepID=UPI00101E60D5|nr:aldehyde dehydrogenase family protein [Streptomyces sp. F001]RZB14217.1 aldehyde dehydrogenase family protein [Streptomyces sp. F001]